MSQSDANEMLRGWHDCKRGVSLDRTNGQPYSDGWFLARLQVLRARLGRVGS